MPDVLSSSVPMNATSPDALIQGAKLPKDLNTLVVPGAFCEARTRSLCPAARSQSQSPARLVVVIPGPLRKPRKSTFPAALTRGYAEASPKFCLNRGLARAPAHWDLSR